MEARTNVCGVAYYNATIYIVCHKMVRESGKSFRRGTVFFISADSTSQEVPKELSVAGLVDPRDIVACNHSHRLFIADCNPVNPCIFQVHINNSESSPFITRGKEMRKHAEMLSPVSLHLSGNNLLVTSKSDDSVAVSIYDGNGTCVRNIQLLPYMSPSHAVLLQNGDVIVCLSTDFTNEVSTRLYASLTFDFT